MFERFTDGARRAVVLAQEEARRLHHDWVGTEHLLLGLITEGQGVGAKALTSLGVSSSSVLDEIEQVLAEEGREQQPTGHLPFTPRSTNVLGLSLREALDLGHDEIGTEHILLGLVRDGDGVAPQVLVKLGATPERVRARVMDLLAGPVRPESL